YKRFETIENELKALRESTQRHEQELKALREDTQRHGEDLSRLNRKLDVLGTRWGIISEDAFRNTVKEFLSGVGYSVDKWSHFDDGGYVYGYPSQIDLDLIVKDSRLIVAEIKSSVGRGDLWALKRKVELYEMVTGVKVNEVYVITYYVNERHPDVARKMAEGLGIRLVEPEELTN
ncbi:PD-(D/E)XK nuclease family protein, partial [Caldivirga sp.]|uniref:PD-(D/E)XK nuclease family protein n=1 Tax=Caldivirga sp. TaxID=2080243 RepID=UPI003D0A6C0E